MGIYETGNPWCLFVGNLATTTNLLASHYDQPSQLQHFAASAQRRSQVIGR